MRMWQLILGLLLHYTPMADTLHLCFPLGHSGRLPLVVCCFLLSWSRFAEDRIVLGNVSWQFGLSLFVFRHFFLLSMGHGFDMKWAGVAKFFGHTIYIGIILCILLYIFKYIHTYAWGYKLVNINKPQISFQLTSIGSNNFHFRLNQFQIYLN